MWYYRNLHWNINIMHTKKLEVIAAQLYNWIYPLSLPPGITYLKSKTKQDIKKCWSGQLAKRTDAVEWFHSVQHRWVSKLHFQIKNDSFVLHLYPYWGTFMQKCLSTQNQTTISCISKKIRTTLIPVKSQMCR